MLERILRRFFTHDTLGWTEYDEVFWRYNIFKCRWFNFYIHRIDAPKPIPQCHSHPWWFITLIIKNGYLERIGNEYFKRPAGYIAYHPPEFSHTVTTPYGRSWSAVLTGPTSVKWNNQECT